MSAVQALNAARDAGIRIGIDGGALTLEADAASPPAVLDLLARHGPGVVALLRRGYDGKSSEDWRAISDDRSGIDEVDRRLARDRAEARAFAACVAEWLNHNPVRSPPGRCLGCNGNEQSHDPLLPFGAEHTGHAWLLSRCRKFPNDFGKNGDA